MKLFGEHAPDGGDGYVPGAWDEVRAATQAGHVSMEAYEVLHAALLLPRLHAEGAAQPAPDQERIAHTVTRVSHQGKLSDIPGQPPEYGPLHWHVACHNSDCTWYPDEEAGGAKYEGCEQWCFTEEQAEKLVNDHIVETGT